MAEEHAKRETPPGSRPLGGGAEFARDVAWLIGWGVRRAGLAVRRRSAEGGFRGCLGLAASALALFFAAILIRRRKR